MTTSSKKLTDGFDLAEEIVANAREDRDRLVKIAESIVKLGSVRFDGGDKKSDDLDAEINIAMAEEMTKITDSLTRINQQLVELVKIEKKGSPSDPTKTSLSEKEKGKIYDEVEKARKVATS